MIFPDYENLSEKRICQECYGYSKEGTDLCANSFVNLIPFLLKMLRGCVKMASIPATAKVVEQERVV